jgi:hypothetical protein
MSSLQQPAKSTSSGKKIFFGVTAFVVGTFVLLWFLNEMLF